MCTSGVNRRSFLIFFEEVLIEPDLDFFLRREEGKATVQIQVTDFLDVLVNPGIRLPRPFSVRDETVTPPFFKLLPFYSRSAHLYKEKLL